MSDQDLTPEAVERFITQYESGQQGCHMDADDAQAFAATLRAQAAEIERLRGELSDVLAERGFAEETTQKAESEARTAYARGLEDGAQIVSEKADEWWRLPFGDDFTATDLTDLAAAIRALAPDPEDSTE